MFLELLRQVSYVFFRFTRLEVEGKTPQVKKKPPELVPGLFQDPVRLFDCSARVRPPSFTRPILRPGLLFSVTLPLVIEGRHYPFFRSRSASGAPFSVPSRPSVHGFKRIFEFFIRPTFCAGSNRQRLAEMLPQFCFFVSISRVDPPGRSK